MWKTVLRAGDTVIAAKQIGREFSCTITVAEGRSLHHGGQCKKQGKTNYYKICINVAP